MSEELRRELEAAAGRSVPPDVDEMWHAGRRRRARRRSLAAGSAGAVLVLGLVAGLVAVRPDDAESVRAGRVSTSCDPIPASQSEAFLGLDSEAFLSAPQAPRTPAAMVHGGGSEQLLEPDVVARVRVIDTTRTSATSTEHRSEVEVTDPVFGAKAGDRLIVSDLALQWLTADLSGTKRQIQRSIAEVQDQIDELNRPLVDLDGRIVATPPTDPGYADLVQQREAMKHATDPDRIALQGKLSDLQQRLQVAQVGERLVRTSGGGTPCHRFAPRDDLVVALVRRPDGSGAYELTGSSSFFLVDGDGFSADLDRARRSVPSWGDSPLLQLVRRSTPDELLAHLRSAN